MWVRVLGSAAGGGFPQWNCTCPPCRAVRTGSRPCTARTQSSIAVSADRSDWFLLNASPDIRSQIESFPSLHPDDGRITRLRAVLLTDAELDHTLGLPLLREGRGLEVHATESAHETLMTGTGILRVLEAYCPVKWQPVLPDIDVALGQGLAYHAFEAPTDKTPRFAGTVAHGRVVGYRITDVGSGRSLVYLPCMQRLTDGMIEELYCCSAMLVDGTCWQDDEMRRLGLAGNTSRDMGHLPIAGADGSLERLAPLPVERKTYIHVNNTNPILLDDSPERRLLDQRGMDVAVDGLEFEI